MFKLNKSFGVIINGVHTLYTKGQQFMLGVDDEIITLLHKLGAEISEVADTEVDDKAELAEISEVAKADKTGRKFKTEKAG